MMFHVEHDRQAADSMRIEPAQMFHVERGEISGGLWKAVDPVTGYGIGMFHVEQWPKHTVFEECNARLLSFRSLKAS